MRSTKSSNVLGWETVKCWLSVAANPESQLHLISRPIMVVGYVLMQSVALQHVVGMTLSAPRARAVCSAYQLGNTNSCAINEVKQRTWMGHC